MNPFYFDSIFGINSFGREGTPSKNSTSIFICYYGSKTVQELRKMEEEVKKLGYTTRLKIGRLEIKNCSCYSTINEIARIINPSFTISSQDL